jgi:polysaccharide biosynthesis/export protein
MKKPDLPFLILIVMLAACGMCSAQMTSPLESQTYVKASENYIISSLDVIHFRIIGEAETETEVRVASDGSVTLPYIGTVSISGVSVAEARNILLKKYSEDYYVNPQIDMVIVSYKQRRVNVTGMVNHPGFVIFPPEEKMTLLGAIALAGDWRSDRMASRTVKLIRNDENGQTKTYEIDTTKINPDDWQLQDGDMVLVPERMF